MVGLVTAANALETDLETADTMTLPVGVQTEDGKHVVFNAPFWDTHHWSTRSTAYPHDTTHGHPSDNKLDRITPNSRPEGRTFYAVNAGSAWETKLMTTEICRWPMVALKFTSHRYRSKERWSGWLFTTCTSAVDPLEPA